MARSHPPTVLTSLRRTWREEIAPSLASERVRVLVAVSGGIDSMVLLDALAKSRGVLGIELVAHGVDHGLRAEAAEELDTAERAAAVLGVPFTRTGLALSDGGNLQARARSARYAALRAAAQTCEATLIATAHHADDRAETVLLRLLRGTGPRGLAVLPARSGDRVRPLIRARRADIVAHARRHGLAFREDPSNRNARFLRTRVRHELLPLLCTLSPQIVEHLNSLADEIAEAHFPAAPSAGISLGRAQRRELRRMLKTPSSAARLRLPGGRELCVDPVTGKVRIEG